MADNETPDGAVQKCGVGAVKVQNTMSPATRSLKQTNVKPNSNSVGPTRLKTRLARANALTTSPGKASSSDKESDYSVESTMSSPQNAHGDRSNEGNSQTTKRKKTEQSQKGRKKKSKDDKKEKDLKPTEQTTTVRSMDDINPAIIDIPHPEGSPFADAVSPDTLQFMADLAENNEREFMLLHNERWLKTKQDFTDFVGQVMEHTRQLDPSILESPAKEAVYRLNRDLRFTNDKRPYKTFLSASFSRGGKKSPFAGYYLSVCPGNRSFIGAGVWSPSSAIISRIREGIMNDPTLLRQALELPMIEEIYGSKGVDALEDDDRLKTAPKGVDKNHPDIDLLRYKSFVIGRRWEDQEVVSEGFLEKVTDAYEALVPFVTVLNAWTG